MKQWLRKKTGSLGEASEVMLPPTQRWTRLCNWEPGYLIWLSPRRFHLTEYRVFVEDDTVLADKLGALGKASKRDGGGNTIQFSAEADGEVLPDGHIRMGKPQPGKFEALD